MSDRRMREELPRFIEPMLLAGCRELPGAGDWAYEVKFDGMRAQLRVERGKCGYVLACGAGPHQRVSGARRNRRGADSSADGPWVMIAEIQDAERRKPARMPGVHAVVAEIEHTAA